ncbi:MAG: adenylate/guanylate cyclase domain-containing protein [Actinobacteria bacterium]|nr:adenylate/guanylate cyclase domain-containing protein [Actinomycetota bacterium]
MGESPVTQYVITDDGAHLAYQVVGDGRLDVVFYPGISIPIDLMWEEPGVARVGRCFSSFCRSIWIESRGFGSSEDPVQRSVGDTSDADLLPVLEATGSGRVVLLGSSHGGKNAIRFAATHPERVEALVLFNSFAHYVRHEDYPSGMPPAALEKFVDGTKSAWGTGSVELLAPSRAGEARFRQWLAVELPGDDHFFFVGDVGAWIEEIEEFLTGRRQAAEGDVALATVVFTDIVNSTARQATLGQRAWASLSEAHDLIVRDAVGRHGGRVIKTLGDGFLALFDLTTRAVRCAQEIVSQTSELGVAVRVRSTMGRLTGATATSPAWRSPSRTASATWPVRDRCSCQRPSRSTSWADASPYPNMAFTCSRGYPTDGDSPPSWAETYLERRERRQPIRPVVRSKAEGAAHPAATGVSARAVRLLFRLAFDGFDALGLFGDEHVGVEQLADELDEELAGVIGVTGSSFRRAAMRGGPRT